MTTRQKFTWLDPTTGKKYKDLITTPQLRNLLENVIESEEQAEHFFAAYSKVSKHAEHNVGYLAGLISDPDLKEDVLDLFLVEERLQPMPLLDREFSLSTWVRGNG